MAHDDGPGGTGEHGGSPSPPGNVLSWWDDEPPGQPGFTATAGQAPRPAPAPQWQPVRDAREFTDERMLAPRREVPTDGWRRAVHELTGGWIRPRPSRAEREWDALLQRCRQPLPGGRRVAVVSRKGGVGKTTTTLMLGHTFAASRGDRVIAVDGNPDAGTLGHRVRREHSVTVTDLLERVDRVRGYPALRAFTSQAPSRLEVLASDDDPHISRALGAEDYQRVVAALEAHYNLLLLDTGTGVLDSATAGILAAADQLVLVASPSLDGARAASLTLDWLRQQGRTRLVADAVTVLNAGRDLGRVHVDRIHEHFASRCRACVRVPFDTHLETGAVSDPDRLAPATQDAFLRAAAAVADGFGLPSARSVAEPAPS